MTYIPKVIQNLKLKWAFKDISQAIETFLYHYL